MSGAAVKIDGDRDLLYPSTSLARIDRMRVEVRHASHVGSSSRAVLKNAMLLKVPGNPVAMCIHRSTSRCRAPLHTSTAPPQVEIMTRQRRMLTGTRQTISTTLNSNSQLQHYRFNMSNPFPSQFLSSQVAPLQWCIVLKHSTLPMGACHQNALATTSTAPDPAVVLCNLRKWPPHPTLESP